MTARNETIAKSILITGATGAIGTALAELYAGPDVVLYLHGRNIAKLERLAGVCRRAGAIVMTHACDVRQTGTLCRWLHENCAPGGPDLAILAAGVNTSIGVHGEPEPRDEAEAVLDVNIKGAISVITALVPGMLERGSGQIAVFSSLAGYFGLPLTPAYSASKAALKAYGESLRGWLAPRGIRVSVIMPGYVKSAMCDGMPGPKPFLWAPEKAARHIRQGLERDRARISFPFPLNWGTWWLAVLPAAVSSRIVRRLGYGR
ncbi:SDR family NAD(P)-dependent oxidoreductase [Nitratidesulfovibrio termitidis]|uniref:SDR family NAD(P)-dependent oxidoreductase n=1 Tax=Nitratidesulfovibrio termitidis TaxID=42252 RepID=UPI0003FD39CC|nr:SDR family NAD(P)-dependent oxidoreductase [Nitratidesulfovibrio termitidis]